MDDKIDETLQYYFVKRKDILDLVNRSNNLSAEEIIEYGEEMAILEYKITALQIAKGD
ncbi:hypothetical protein [Seonamhaeicola maritimus]|uniref:hypothetical protein n=1 Tax=Seonamhaeicola maritimus TaxID=2591822 RepID=UPI00147905DD|nr:hypothetical protein [Seonamhaeicola maritimus]